MRLICPLFLLFGAFLPAAAQSGIGIPALGFAYDSSLGAIRPILGIPGAAILGSPLDSGSTLEAAAISPQQDFALAVSAGDHTVRIVRFAGAGASVLSLDGGMSSPDRMIFSPSGSSALLYRQDSGRLQILTGLPGAAAIRELSMSGLNAPSALAISDDSSLTLLAGQGSDPSWVTDPDGNLVPLALPASTVAVSFRRGSHDLLSATRAGDLYLAQAVDTFPPFVQITGGAVPSPPVALRFSSDGSASYVLGADGTVATVDLSTGASQSISCGCKPAAFEPLQLKNMFRLTEISNLPVMLFEASSGPRVWFVPPDPPAAKSSENHQ
jgi:hypothetical protein